MNQALAYGPEVEYVAVLLELNCTVARSEGCNGRCFDRALLDACRVRLGQAESLIGDLKVSQRRNLPEPSRATRWPTFRHPGLDPASSFERRSAPEARTRSVRAGPDEIDPRSRRILTRPRAPSSPATSSPPRAAPASSTWPPIMARTISCCASEHGIDPVFAVEADGKYRADWAWLRRARQRHQPQVQRARWPDLQRPARSWRIAGRIGGLPAFLSPSWRSKAKVIFRCTPQWFVPMDRALGANGVPPFDKLRVSGRWRMGQILVPLSLSLSKATR